MTKAGEKMIEAAKEAVARGEALAARNHVTVDEEMMTKIAFLLGVPAARVMVITAKEMSAEEKRHRQKYNDFVASLRDDP